MDSFIGMTDTQVLDIAKSALALAETLTPGTKARAVAWARFDAAMAELTRRAMAHVLWRIHEQEKKTE